MGCVFVDHRNHNTLDNQKSNLRLSNKSLNAMNSKPKSCYAGKARPSKFKGVSQKQIRGVLKWRMVIKCDGKTIDKIFESEILAAQAYDEYAKQYFGEYAYLNFGASEKPAPIED